MQTQYTPSPESVARAIAQDEDEQRSLAEETERDTAIALHAKATIEQEGKIEIDADATVSHGDDNGAYVRAWVWVDFTGTVFDKNAPQ